MQSLQEEPEESKSIPDEVMEQVITGNLENQSIGIEVQINAEHIEQLPDDDEEVFDGYSEEFNDLSVHEEVIEDEEELPQPTQQVHQNTFYQKPDEISVVEEVISRKEESHTTELPKTNSLFKMEDNILDMSLTKLHPINDDGEELKEEEKEETGYLKRQSNAQTVLQQVANSNFEVEEPLEEPDSSQLCTRKLIRDNLQYSEDGAEVKSEMTKSFYDEKPIIESYHPRSLNSQGDIIGQPTTQGTEEAKLEAAKRQIAEPSKSSSDPHPIVPGVIRSSPPLSLSRNGSQSNYGEQMSIKDHAIQVNYNIVTTSGDAYTLEQRPKTPSHGDDQSQDDYVMGYSQKPDRAQEIVIEEDRLPERACTPDGFDQKPYFSQLQEPDILTRVSREGAETPLLLDSLNILEPRPLSEFDPQREQQFTVAHQYYSNGASAGSNMAVMEPNISSIPSQYNVCSYWNSTESPLEEDHVDSQPLSYRHEEFRIEEQDGNDPPFYQEESPFGQTNAAEFEEPPAPEEEDPDDGEVVGFAEQTPENPEEQQFDPEVEPAYQQENSPFIQEEPVNEDRLEQGSLIEEPVAEIEIRPEEEPTAPPESPFEQFQVVEAAAQFEQQFYGQSPNMFDLQASLPLDERQEEKRTSDGRVAKNIRIKKQVNPRYNRLQAKPIGDRPTTQQEIADALIERKPFVSRSPLNMSQEGSLKRKQPRMSDKRNWALHSIEETIQNWPYSNIQPLNMHISSADSQQSPDQFGPVDGLSTPTLSQMHSLANSISRSKPNMLLASTRRAGDSTFAEDPSRQRYLDLDQSLINFENQQPSLPPSNKLSQSQLQQEGINWNSALPTNSGSISMEADSRMPHTFTPQASSKPACLPRESSFQVPTTHSLKHVPTPASTLPFRKNDLAKIRNYVISTGPQSPMKYSEPTSLRKGGRKLKKTLVLPGKKMKGSRDPPSRDQDLAPLKVHHYAQDWNPSKIETPVDRILRMVEYDKGQAFDAILRPELQSKITKLISSFDGKQKRKRGGATPANNDPTQVQKLKKLLKKLQLREAYGSRVAVAKPVFLKDTPADPSCLSSRGLLNQSVGSRHGPYQQFYQKQSPTEMSDDPQQDILNQMSSFRADSQTTGIVSSRGLYNQTSQPYANRTVEPSFIRTLPKSRSKVGSSKQSMKPRLRLSPNRGAPTLPPNSSPYSSKNVKLPRNTSYETGSMERQKKFILASSTGPKPQPNKPRRGPRIELVLDAGGSSTLINHAMAASTQHAGWRGYNLMV